MNQFIELPKINMQKIIAIAPMLDLTNRHYRYFMRQITRSTVLYTEMIVADAILHGNPDKLLKFSPIEQPLIVQLGGSDPDKLKLSSIICQEYGYSGINLNVGCPSNRVTSGNFGACLMQDPQLVAKCIKTMQDSVSIPISIKHRIGLDYNYDYSLLYKFVETIADCGCNEFIIHARNAVLSGLSPKQNREIPPLKYEVVYKLKQDFPRLKIIINGGIKTVAEIHEHLKYVDGVMIGREAYSNPYIFNEFDSIFFDHPQTHISRNQISLNMIEYLKQCLENNIPLHHITAHMTGLYHGQDGAKRWRYTLTNEMAKTNNLDTYTQLVESMDLTIP